MRLNSSTPSSGASLKKIGVLWKSGLAFSDLVKVAIPQACYQTNLDLRNFALILIQKENLNKVTLNSNYQSISEVANQLILW